MRPVEVGVAQFATFATVDQLRSTMVTDTGDRDDLGIDGLGPGVRIGTGGSAVVYRSRQDELDRDVAVKILGGVVDKDARRRFDRERRLMGRLSQHEGMVTVHQTGFTDRDEPYIVMPVLGRSLDDEIKERPIPWERAVEIMADVSRTVAFAHDQDVVHRDLKPGNIMLSTSGRPLVADFGIARIVDSKTNLEATALTLTPAYSPPEALETTVADPTSDIYSLGATLYALIAGHPPYCAPGSDQTLMTLMRNIVDDPAPQLGDAAPAEIQAVIDRSMAKQPQDRYRSAEQLADALDDALLAARTRALVDDTVIVAPPDDVPAAPGADRSRAPRGLLVAVGAVLALVAVVAGVIVAGSGDGDGEEAVAPDEVTTAATVADAVADANVDSADDADLADDDADSADDDADAGGSSSAAAAPVDDEPVDTTTTDTVLVVAGGEVFLLPFDETGDSAFTESVATPPDSALRAFAQAGGLSAAIEEADGPDAAENDDGAPTVVTGVSGTTEGVFAGSSGVAPCRPDELVAQLDPDAEETAAWADVQNIEVDEIPAFVDGLTAVVMTTDARITDHDFVDGEAVPRQVVLQAGTGVLVDEFGGPRVRCQSGSPLATPEPVEGTTNFIGDAWETFDPADTSAVVAAPEPVEEFVLTDVAGGDDFIRPVGSSGAADRPLLPGEIRATGGFTSFPDIDPATFDVNEIDFIFRPEGGDVTGDGGYSVTFKGVTISSTLDFTGTFDAAAGTMSGTATGNVEAGGVAGGAGSGGWTAVVDPAAGTIIGDADGQASFELTFTPYTR